MKKLSLAHFVTTPPNKFANSKQHVKYKKLQSKSGKDVLIRGNDEDVSALDHDLDVVDDPQGEEEGSNGSKK